MSLPAQPLPDAVRPRVIVVDPDRRVQQSLADALRLGGLDVIATAGNVRAALEAVERGHPDVVIVDPRLPDVDAGSTLLASLGLGWPRVRVVVMGWTGGFEAAPAGGPLPVIPKNADPDDFVAAAISACSA